MMDGTADGGSAGMEPAPTLASFASIDPASPQGPSLDIPEPLEFRTGHGLSSPPPSSPLTSPKQGLPWANLGPESFPQEIHPKSQQLKFSGQGAAMATMNLAEDEEGGPMFVDDHADQDEQSEDETMFVENHADNEDEAMFVDSHVDQEDEPIFIEDIVEVVPSVSPENPQVEASDGGEVWEILEEDIPQDARKKMETDASRGHRSFKKRGIKREHECDGQSDDTQIIEKNELSVETLERLKRPRAHRQKKDGQENWDGSLRQTIKPEIIEIDDEDIQWLQTLPRPAKPPRSDSAITIIDELDHSQKTPIKIEEVAKSALGKGKAKETGSFGPVDGVEQGFLRSWGGSNESSAIQRSVRIRRKIRELEEKEKAVDPITPEDYENLTRLRKKAEEIESQINKANTNGEEGGESSSEEEAETMSDDDSDPEYTPAAIASAPARKKPRGGSGKAGPRAQGKKSNASKKPPPRSAQEWWAREYAKSAKKGKAESETVPDLFHICRPENRRKKGKRVPVPTDPQGKQLLDMLRDQDPIAARAALGDMPKPGAVGAKGKDEFFKAFKAEMSKNSAPKDLKDEFTLLKRASQSFGGPKCQSEGGQWRLNGLATKLYHHQLVGVHWMLGREFSPTGPFGGMLADQMGLGKTVEMLATMMHNPGKPTLIVVPAAAIPQWKEEIKKHIEPKKSLKVFHYRASGINKNIDWVEDADVVIVSYQEVAKAYPSEDSLRRISGMGLEGEQWRKELDDQLGDLYRVNFHRVVLDEAHAIKNINSRTSKACVHLPGKYRWALSGTPIHNCIEELLPYFRFLGVDWALKESSQSQNKYGQGSKAEIASAKENLKSMLAVIVPTLMIRRRVEDKFVGEDLLRIPKTHTPVVKQVDLSVEERIIYQRLEERFRDNINGHLRGDDSDGEQKKMRTYFAYLTRLRQMVGHPFLVETPMRIDFTLEDIKHIRKELADRGGVSPLHVQIRRWMDTEEDRRRREEGQQSGNEFGISGFGDLFNMDLQLSRIESEKRMADVTCRVCYELPQGHRFTECGHIFCTECIQNLVEEAQRRGKEAKCTACSAVIRGHELLSQDMSGRDIGNEAGPAQRPRDKRPPRKRARTQEQTPVGPGIDCMGIEPRNADKTAKFLEIAKMDKDSPLPASAKTTAVKRVILDWLRDYPDDKIIVFTHWIPLAQILGHMLNAESIKFVYYCGVMSVYQRQDAIRTFSNPENGVQVLLASTKCGGQALNLTAANRVILVDLWWNSAVEQQAFGRVHRIGQTKETHFVKIVTLNTIDQRLLDMQKRKDAVIGKTLRDGQSLSEKEILWLFGEPTGDDGENGDDDERGGAAEKNKKKNKSSKMGKGEDEIDRGETLLSSDDSESEPATAKGKHTTPKESENGEGSSKQNILLIGNGSDAAENASDYTAAAEQQASTTAGSTGADEEAKGKLLLAKPKDGGDDAPDDKSTLLHHDDDGEKGGGEDDGTEAQGLVTDQADASQSSLAKPDADADMKDATLQHQHQHEYISLDDNESDADMEQYPDDHTSRYDDDEDEDE